MSEQGGKVRRLFPGGNTSRGFHSFYGHILPQDRANRIFVIKGGPGVGKSTFMKRLVDAVVARGYDVECHHCSSDPASLDAFVVPALGVAMLDGTAPHVVDPINPGAVDEIVDLGDYWDAAGIRANRADILALNREVGEQFRRAYRYLKAAKPLFDDWRHLNAQALNPGWCNGQAEQLVRQLFGVSDPVEQPGRVRHLFASAITPEGPKHHLGSLFGHLDRRVVLTGPPGTGKSTLVKRLADAAVVAGFDVECLHCPFDPDRIEHLVIPAISVGVVSSTRPHYYESRPGDILIHMGPGDRRTAATDEPGKSDGGDVVTAADARVVRSEHIELAQRLFWQLFDHAVSHLRRAKELHDEMERYYVPHMNFEQVEAVRVQTLEQILSYAKEEKSAPAE